MTRRRFVASAAALSPALRSMAVSTESPAGWVLLGTDKGKGIYRARWNGATGAVGTPELAFATDTPDFFAMHPSLPVLYSVNESIGVNAAVSSFQATAATAELQLINRRETHGNGPCFVSVDRTGNMAFAANYAGGSLTAFALGPDGSLAQTVGVLGYNQPTHGPVPDRQEAAHMHCATVSPENNFVLACDLGDDLILVFPIAPERNNFIGSPLRVQARAGSGPRHLAFHPNGIWLYCIHELDCTVDLYDWSVHGGEPAMTLREGSVVSTLAPGTNKNASTAAEIVMSDDGRFVYTCTRGENTIAVYAIDGNSGLLRPVQRLSCGGDVPRYIGFDPTRRWLVCANQGSSTLTVFAHDSRTGRLTPKPGHVAANTPMFILWL